MRVRVLFVVVAMAAAASVSLSAQKLPIEIATLSTPAPATAVVFARTGRLVAVVCEDKKLRVWSLPALGLLRTIDLAGRRLTSTAVSADGRFIAVGDFGGEYTVWNTASGERQMQLKLLFYPTTMAFSFDGTRLAIAPVGEPVQVFDVASAKKQLDLQRVTGGTAALAFSRDGSRLATADADTAVRLYDATDGKLLATNTDFLVEPLAAAFTADGKHVLTGGGDKYVAWLDASTAKAIRKSGRADDPIAALDISPDGALVASVLMHADNMLMPGPIIVSEVTSGRRVTEWLPATVALGGGWTDDGRLLMATSDDKGLHIWRVR